MSEADALFDAALKWREWYVKRFDPSTSQDEGEDACAALATAVERAFGLQDSDSSSEESR